MRFAQANLGRHFTHMHYVQFSQNTTQFYIDTYNMILCFKLLYATPKHIKEIAPQRSKARSKATNFVSPACSFSVIKDLLKSRSAIIGFNAKTDYLLMSEEAILTIKIPYTHNSIAFCVQKSYSSKVTTKCAMHACALVLLSVYDNDYACAVVTSV